MDLDKVAGLYSQVMNLRKRLKEMDTSKTNPSEISAIADALEKLETRLEKQNAKKKQRMLEKENKEKQTQEVAKESAWMYKGWKIEMREDGYHVWSPDGTFGSGDYSSVKEAKEYIDSRGDKEWEEKAKEKVSEPIKEPYKEGDAKVEDDKVIMPKDEFIDEHEHLVKVLETPAEEAKEQKKELEEVKEAKAPFDVDSIVEPVKGTPGSEGRVMIYDPIHKLVYVKWDKGTLKEKHDFGGYSPSDLRVKGTDGYSDYLYKKTMSKEDDIRKQLDEHVKQWQAAPSMKEKEVHIQKIHELRDELSKMIQPKASSEWQELSTLENALDFLILEVGYDITPGDNGMSWEVTDPDENFVGSMSTDEFVNYAKDIKNKLKDVTLPGEATPVEQTIEKLPTLDVPKKQEELLEQLSKETDETKKQELVRQLKQLRFASIKDKLVKKAYSGESSEELKTLPNGWTIYVRELYDSHFPDSMISLFAVPAATPDIDDVVWGPTISPSKKMVEYWKKDEGTAQELLEILLEDVVEKYLPKFEKEVSILEAQPEGMVPGLAVHKLVLPKQAAQILPDDESLDIKAHCGHCGSEPAGIGYGGDRPGIAVEPKRDESVSLEAAWIDVANKKWWVEPKFDELTKKYIYKVLNDQKQPVMELKFDQVPTKEVIEQAIWEQLDKHAMLETSLKEDLAVLKRGHKVKILEIDSERKQVKFASLEHESVMGWAPLEKFAWDMGMPAAIRKAVRAVQPHNYEVEEYDMVNSTFKKMEIPRKDTKMRMDDPTKSPFEIRDPYGNWTLTTPEVFNKWKQQWDVDHEKKFKKPVEEVPAVISEIDNESDGTIYKEEAFSKEAYIKKEHGEWCVHSEKNPSWSGGCYKTKEEAKKRLQQVEMFKHMNAKKLSKRDDNNIVAVKEDVLRKLEKECPDCYKKFLKFAHEKNVKIKLIAEQTTPVQTTTPNITDQVNKIRERMNTVKEKLQTQAMKKEAGLDMYVVSDKGEDQWIGGWNWNTMRGLDQVLPEVGKLISSVYDTRPLTVEEAKWISSSIRKYIDTLPEKGMIEALYDMEDKFSIGPNRNLPIKVAMQKEASYGVEYMKTDLRDGMTNEEILKKYKERYPKSPDEEGRKYLDKAIEELKPEKKAYDFTLDKVKLIEPIEQPEKHPIEEPAVEELIKWVELDLDMIENTYRDKPEVIQHIEEIENDVEKLEHMLGLEDVEPMHELSEPEHKEEIHEESARKCKECGSDLELTNVPLGEGKLQYKCKQCGKHEIVQAEEHKEATVDMQAQRPRPPQEAPRGMKWAYDPKRDDWFLVATEGY